MLQESNVEETWETARWAVQKIGNNLMLERDGVSGSRTRKM
jgi:hypothetical protein